MKHDDTFHFSVEKAVLFETLHSCSCRQPNEQKVSNTIVSNSNQPSLVSF